MVWIGQKKKQLCAWVNYISDHTKVTRYISGHHLRLLGMVRHIYIYGELCVCCPSPITYLLNSIKTKCNSSFSRTD
jgi:hypothetical protein